MRRSLVHVLLLVLLPACTKQAPPPAEDPQRMECITFRRTGGFAGFDDQVEIRPDGRASIAHRGERPREIQLTVEQLALLREAFRGFSSFANDYPSPPNTADELHYRVSYGGKTVTASDAHRDVPQRLRHV